MSLTKTEIKTQQETAPGVQKASGSEQAVAEPNSLCKLNVLCPSREEILSFLMSDPAEKVQIEEETTDKNSVTMSSPIDEESPLFSQAIDMLKKQFGELGIGKNGDEIFESSHLNVGKYVIGPTLPKKSDSGLDHINDMIVSNATCRRDATRPCDPESIFIFEGGMTAGSDQADVAEDVDEYGMSPIPPPNTPVEERIWWRNDFFVIKKSPLGGLGAFAAKDLKYGDVILVERPLLLTNNWELCNFYEQMSDEDKQLLHSLHKWSVDPNAHEIERIRRANSFQLPGAVGIYSVTSRFNHACLSVRNTNYVMTRREANIVLTIIKTVPKGTELTVCYGGRPEQLLRSYGFRCECGGCIPLTDEQADAVVRASKGEENWRTMAK